MLLVAVPFSPGCSSRSWVQPFGLTLSLLGDYCSVGVRGDDGFEVVVEGGGAGCKRQLCGHGVASDEKGGKEAEKGGLGS